MTTNKELFEQIAYACSQLLILKEKQEKLSRGYSTIELAAAEKVAAAYDYYNTLVDRAIEATAGDAPAVDVDPLTFFNEVWVTPGCECSDSNHKCTAIGQEYMTYNEMQSIATERPRSTEDLEARKTSPTAAELEARKNSSSSEGTPI